LLERVALHFDREESPRKPRHNYRSTSAEIN
jgi:hypothetical protein